MITLLLFASCGQDDKAGKTADVLESTMGTIARSSSEGASLTRKKCASCHSLDRNIRKVGPSLKGIVGKKPTIGDVPFDAWTEEALDKWLENPRSVKKKTRMALPGISDAGERKAIIDYLKTI